MFWVLLVGLYLIKAVLPSFFLSKIHKFVGIFLLSNVNLKTLI